MRFAEMRPQGKRWTLTHAPDEHPAPQSVQALLASRIDLLEPDAKEALQAASVAGRVFSPAALAELTRGPLPHLSALGDRGFVSARPDGEWAFKHALTREVAYASLPRRRRARLHAAFAAWLERERGSDENAPLIAHHLYEALRPEHADLAWAGDEDEAEQLRVRAGDRLRRAAELAKRRYAMEEAAALYENALTLENDPARRAELLHSIAGAHWLRYDSVAYQSAMERALALDPPRELAAELYAELAFNGAGRVSVWRELPPADAIATWTRRAFELAEPETSAYARALLASVMVDPQSGAAAAAEALTIAERTDDLMLVARACEANATVASAEHRFDEACAWCERQLELAPQLDDPDARSSQYWHAFFSFVRAGRLTEAATFAQRHDEMAAPLTPHHEVHATALHILHATVTCSWEEAVALTQRAKLAAERNAETPCAFNWRSLAMCALAEAELGNERAAHGLADDVLRLAARPGPEAYEPALLRLALALGDLDEVARLLESLPASGGPWDLDAAAARLDALVALGSQERVEEEASPWLDIRCYTRPFALRALGVMRPDGTLLARARSEFDALGLARRVEETDGEGSRLRRKRPSHEL